SRSRLVRESHEEDALARAVRRSFHADRSGDVTVVLKPYHIFSGILETGTGHGTPHDYDTHVPLVVFGPKIKPGIHQELVSPHASAAILDSCLGIKPPANADTAIPSDLIN